MAAAPDFHDTGRYGVVRYFDAFGAWYAVIDQQRENAIVYSSKSRNAAHARADQLNRRAQETAAC